MSLSKTNNGVDIVRKMYYAFPRNTLITIYKSFIRTHVDNQKMRVFLKKIESVHDNAVLAIARAIRASSREKNKNIEKWF